MVHLGGPPGPEVYRGLPGTSEADKELLNGQEAEEESQEASGVNGGDLEEREREEGGESREPRGWQKEWGAARQREPPGGGDGGAQVLDAERANQTVVDLDALIGESALPYRTVALACVDPLALATVL